MSKSLKQWIPIGLAFALLAITCYAMFKASSAFISFLQSVNPTVGAAIVAAVATFLVGIYTQYVLKKRQMEDAHREKKIQIYEEFMKMAAAHLAQENENLKHKKIPHEKVVDFFFRFKTDLILRGSSQVIKAIAKFESVSSEGGDVLGAVDEIYRAMRKDVGLSNFGLKPKELVGVYVKSEDRGTLLR